MPIASRVRMDGAGGCLRLQSRRRDWLGSVQGEHAHAVMVDASLSIERSINLRGSAEKIFQHRVYPGGDHALDQVLGVEPTNCPCDI